MNDIELMRMFAEKAIKDGQNRIVQERANPSPRTQYMQRVTSLKRWIYRVNEIGMLSVPTLFGPSIPVDDIFKVLDGNPASTAITEAMEWLNAKLHDDMMWRWDCCAPYSLKSAMGSGKSYQVERASDGKVYLEFDDPRFIDILGETYRETIDFCVRPWTNPLKVDGYPVEFRCYVFPYAESGPYPCAVSSYYPQRPLPDEWTHFAAQAKCYAKDIASASPEFSKYGFTADFLVKSGLNEYELFFLEGGPAFGMGAHPCCFNPNGLTAERILLAPEEGAILG